MVGIGKLGKPSVFTSERVKRLGWTPPRMLYIVNLSALNLRTVQKFEVERRKTPTKSMEAEIEERMLDDIPILNWLTVRPPENCFQNQKRTST